MVLQNRKPAPHYSVNLHITEDIYMTQRLISNSNDSCPNTQLTFLDEKQQLDKLFRHLTGRDKFSNQTGTVINTIYSTTCSTFKRTT